MPPDQQKFVEWIDLCHGALFKHALWMTGNRSLAEDLLQETFYQAWKSRHAIENETSPLPWLLTILRRALYKELQQTRLETIPLDEQHLENPQSLASEDLDMMVDLGKGLMSMSARQRDLLLLHVLHGFSYEQISEQVGIPLGTVMSRISRARQVLKVFYANDDFDEKVVVPFKKKSLKVAPK